MQTRGVNPILKFTLSRSVIFQVLVVVAVGLWIYWPTLHGDWLWDDDVSIVRDYNLRTIKGLGNIWLGLPEMGGYWPLSWTVLWVEWHLFRNDTLGYHLVSVCLHILSGLLIWRLLNRLGLRWGWFGGFLFVVHPLAVESVSWMIEIKNTLSLPLLLLSFEAYLEQNGNKRAYLCSLFFYFAAMLAKSSGIMLPVVLLLYAWWKNNRLSLDDFKKLFPFFLIAVVLGLVTVIGQNPPEVSSASIFAEGPLSRLATAGTAILFYLGKFTLPIGLIPIYPRWTFDPPTVLSLLTFPMLAGLLFGLYASRSSWSRHAFFGMGFFLITSFPILGFINMAYMNISWVADHLVYFPMVGLIGLVIAGIEKLGRTLHFWMRLGLFGFLVVLAVLLANESRRDAEMYVNLKTVAQAVVRLNPDCWQAHNALGLAMLKEGDAESAILQYQMGLEVAPNYPDAHNNIANALMEIPGREVDAIAEYEKALQIKPDDAEAHYNLGNALMGMKNGLPYAINHYEAAIRIKRDFAEAHNNLGSAFLLAQDHLPEAVTQLQIAIQINPFNAEAYRNLGNAFIRENRLDEAINEYKAAVKINPTFVDAHLDLGNALTRIPVELPEAVKEYRAVIQLNPNSIEAHYNLGVLLSNTPGKMDEAISQFEAVLRLRPGWHVAEQALDRAKTR